MKPNNDKQQQLHKTHVSSSDALLSLNEELRVAESQLKDAERELRVAQWRCRSIKRWMKKVQKQIEKL